MVSVRLRIGGLEIFEKPPRLNVVLSHPEDILVVPRDERNYVCFAQTCGKSPSEGETDPYLVCDQF